MSASRTTPSTTLNALKVKDNEKLIYCYGAGLLFDWGGSYRDFLDMANWMSGQQSKVWPYVDIETSDELTSKRLINPGRRGDVLYSSFIKGRPDQKTGKDDRKLFIRMAAAIGDGEPFGLFDMGDISTLRIIRPQVGFFDIGSEWMRNGVNREKIVEQFEAALVFLFDRHFSLPRMLMSITAPGSEEKENSHQRNIPLRDDHIALFQRLLAISSSVRSGPPATVIVEVIINDVENPSSADAAASDAADASGKGDEESKQVHEERPGKGDEESQGGRAEQSGNEENAELLREASRMDDNEESRKEDDEESRKKDDKKSTLSCPICGQVFFPFNEEDIREHFAYRHVRPETKEQTLETLERFLDRVRPSPAGSPQSSAYSPKDYEPNHPQIDPRLTTQPAGSSHTQAADDFLGGIPLPKCHICGQTIDTTDPEANAKHYQTHKNSFDATQSDLEHLRSTQTLLCEKALYWQEKYQNLNIKAGKTLDELRRYGDPNRSSQPEIGKDPEQKEAESEQEQTPLQQDLLRKTLENFKLQQDLKNERDTSLDLQNHLILMDQKRDEQAERHEQELQQQIEENVKLQRDLQIEKDASSKLENGLRSMGRKMDNMEKEHQQQLYRHSEEKSKLQIELAQAQLRKDEPAQKPDDQNREVAPGQEGTKWLEEELDRRLAEGFQQLEHERAALYARYPNQPESAPGSPKPEQQPQTKQQQKKAPVKKDPPTFDYCGKCGFYLSSMTAERRTNHLNKAHAEPADPLPMTKSEATTYRKAIRDSTSPTRQPQPGSPEAQPAPEPSLGKRKRNAREVTPVDLEAEEVVKGRGKRVKVKSARAVEAEKEVEVVRVTRARGARGKGKQAESKAKGKGGEVKIKREESAEAEAPQEVQLQEEQAQVEQTQEQAQPAEAGAEGQGKKRKRGGDDNAEEPVGRRTRARSKKPQ